MAGSLLPTRPPTSRSSELFLYQILVSGANQRKLREPGSKWLKHGLNQDFRAPFADPSLAVIQNPLSEPELLRRNLEQLIIAKP